MMNDALNFRSDDAADRSYAKWAVPQPSDGSLVEKAIAGTMIRLQSGGMAQIALLLCSFSLAGLLVMALAVIRNGAQ